MIGIVATITAAGSYSGLVSCPGVREALNLDGDFPTDSALKMRIGEAVRRVEGLTRLCLVQSTWAIEIERDAFLNQDFRPDVIPVAGLFPVGAIPDVTLTDAEDNPVPVTATVLGHGDAMLVRTAGSFLEHEFPLTLSLKRGVTSAKLPEDLRSAIIGQIEQLVDGPSPLAEAQIVRTCSRWGWTG